jgi:hypothetical protein
MRWTRSWSPSPSQSWCRRDFVELTVQGDEAKKLERELREMEAEDKRLATLQAFVAPTQRIVSERDRHVIHASDTAVVKLEGVPKMDVDVEVKSALEAKEGGVGALGEESPKRKGASEESRSPRKEENLQAANEAALAATSVSQQPPPKAVEVRKEEKVEMASWISESVGGLQLHPSKKPAIDEGLDLKKKEEVESFEVPQPVKKPRSIGPRHG